MTKKREISREHWVMSFDGWVDYNNKRGER
jgi:hypothetical protein